MLSPARTSIVGRFGSAITNPIYKKLYPHTYSDSLAETDVRIPEWRTASIKAPIPRVVEIEPRRPEILIYADAATGKAVSSSSVLAAIVI